MAKTAALRLRERKGFHNLIALLKAIPNSYSTVMFSDNPGVGLALLALTLVSPIVGISGLLGLIAALLASRLLGFEGWDSTSGVLGFNSLLISLAVAYYYPLNAVQESVYPLLGLLMVASLSTLLLYVGVNFLTQSWFKMPSMSLAFSLSATFFWYYMVRSGYFTGYGFLKPLLIGFGLQLPAFWHNYFLSMASIMFVPDILVGIAVTVVLFCISRIGFMLSLLGWSICALLLQYSNMGSTYGMFFPGFNLILISIAIGSIYLIPGKTSYLLAAFATVVGFLLAYALSGKYYFPDMMPNRPGLLFVPMFAFPMNIVVIVTIYALRLRLKQKSPVINDYGILHPERALDAYLARFKRFSSAGVPQIHLPVTGEWVITQGHDGEHTHKKEWAFAWDFEIRDRAGKLYAEKEFELGDYYCFGKPVHAAAAGYVAKVVSSITDNSIGVVNTLDNWGNYVSISHGYGFYTLYAHLKEGSVKLNEGDYVKQGEKIGLVGNSGRSPVPHLHFHAQIAADAGSKTIFSHLINYKKRASDGSYEFISSGIPEAGDVISGLIPEKDLAPMLQLGYKQSQRFRVRSQNKEWEEHWEVGLDLLGVHTISSDKGTKLEFSVYNGIYNSLNLTHKRGTALAAFAIAASRLPWIENHNLNWKDEPSLSVVMNPFWKNITLFFIPFFKPIRVGSLAVMQTQKNQIIVNSVTKFQVLGLKISQQEAELVMSRKNGIQTIKLLQNNRELLFAEHITDSKQEADNG